MYMAYIYIYIFALFVIFIAILIFKKYGFLTSIFAILTCLIGIPIALNINLLFNPYEPSIRPHQMMSYVYLLPILIIILHASFKKAFKYLLLVFILLLHSQLLQMSVDFDTMYRSKNSTTNIYNLVFSKLLNDNLLSDKYNYYFYGSMDKNELFYTVNFDKHYINSNVINNEFMVGRNYVPLEYWHNRLKLDFVREYMGIKVKCKYDETFSGFCSSDEFLSANPFLSDESIFVIDDTNIVIKLSN